MLPACVVSLLLFIHTAFFIKGQFRFFSATKCMNVEVCRMFLFSTNWNQKGTLKAYKRPSANRCMKKTRKTITFCLCFAVSDSLWWVN